MILGLPLRRQTSRIIVRQCLNPEVVKEYSELLSDTLDENGVRTPPQPLFNCNEIFLSWDYTSEKVITDKNTKNVYPQVRGTTDHTTMLCEASAIGLPLMIIYPK